MRIRFLSTQIYERSPGKGPSFAEGSVLESAAVQEVLGLTEKPTDEWVDGFMNRWLQRGVAVDVTDEADELTAEAGEQDSDEDDDDDVVDLTALTRAELDALAAERGVDISEAKNKGDVIAALELAAEAGEQE